MITLDWYNNGINVLQYGYIHYRITGHCIMWCKLNQKKKNKYNWLMSRECTINMPENLIKNANNAENILK